MEHSAFPPFCFLLKSEQLTNMKDIWVIYWLTLLSLSRARWVVSLKQEDCDIQSTLKAWCHKLFQYANHKYTHHRLPSGLTTDSTDFMTGPFLPSISVFDFSFFITLFLFHSMRQIKLATRQLLGTRYYSPSYPTVCCVLKMLAVNNKKPSYRWGTARRGRASWNLVKFCTNVDDLYLKSSETRLLPIRL